MAVAYKRNRLLPWFIGIVVIAIADAYIAVQLFTEPCQAPAIAQVLALGAVPVVYLWLMYLTFTSQE